jgi:hypothetical protein
MNRYKDFNWSMGDTGTSNPATGGRSYSHDTIKMSILLDLRDELKRLNRFMASLGCIHGTLKGMRRDIQQNRRQKKRKV